MKLDVTKQFSTRLDRVKGIDFHPTEPWVLITQYYGKVDIWLYATNLVVKLIQVLDTPVRCGKFIARKNWIIVGADDFQVRVYNYNTGEKVTQFEAHLDYIRAVAVHPTKPLVLTLLDDLLIKLWNWEAGWRCEQTFEGHQHYVMLVNFNPKDPNTFALACLDRTVKVWLLGLLVPNFTMVAHDVKGVNYVDYYPQADKPYMITASDDKTVKVWDYQTKLCVATLEGHVSNVLFAIFHPELPIIVSGSEDGTLRFWNANTFKLEKLINYLLERAWCVAILPKLNLVAAGFDLGFAIIKLGSEEPLFSMDGQNKVVMAKNTEVLQAVIKPGVTDGLTDGEPLPLVRKDFGSIEVYPQQLAHSPNGRYVAVCGDGEYIIYLALAWRLKLYGLAQEFAWNALDTSNACTFATRELGTLVTIHKNFKVHANVELVYQADKIYAGALLGVKLAGCICFYDWELAALVRRVDIDDEILEVEWLADGDLVAIITAAASEGRLGSPLYETYFLLYNHATFEEALAEGTIDGDEGVETAFDVLYTLPTLEPVLLARFVGDVFVYTTGTTHRLNYFVGGEVINLGHFDHKFYIVGYREADNTLFLIDKLLEVVSWYINQLMLVLQTQVMRGELEQFAHGTVDHEGEQIADVAEISPQDLSSEYADALGAFSKTELGQLARFFEKLGYLGMSYALSQDFDTKFDIALQRGNLDQAFSLLEQHPAAGTPKWKKLGDLALAKWRVAMAQDCYWLAQDYPLLLLVLLSLNNHQELAKLADAATKAGRYNIAYQAHWLTGNTEACLDLLVTLERYPEAAVFGKNYGVNPKKVAHAIDLWKQLLVKNKKQLIADRLEDDSADAATEGVAQLSLDSVQEGPVVPDAAPVAEAEGVFQAKAHQQEDSYHQQVEQQAETQFNEAHDQFEDSLAFQDSQAYQGQGYPQGYPAQGYPQETYQEPQEGYQAPQAGQATYDDDEPSLI